MNPILALREATESAPTVSDVIRQLATLCEAAGGPVRFRVPVEDVVVILVVKPRTEPERTPIEQAAPTGAESAALRRVLSVITAEPQHLKRIAKKLERRPGDHLRRQLRTLWDMGLIDKRPGPAYVLKVNRAAPAVASDDGAKLGTVHRKLLAVISETPMTAKAILARAGYTDNSYGWAAITHLARERLIVRTPDGYLKA